MFNFVRKTYKSMRKLEIGNKYAIIGNSNAIVANTIENNIITIIFFNNTRYGRIFFN